MIKLNLFSKININKFIKWINKKYSINNGNFYFFIFYSININYFRNKFSFKNLEFKWQNDNFWESINYKDKYEIDNFPKLNLNIAIFNEITKEIKNNIINDYKNHISIFVNLYKQLQKNNVVINKLTFYQLVQSFLLHYILFIKTRSYLNNIEIVKKIEIQIYLQKIYTQKMQLIFKDYFNDLYLLLNRILIWE